MIKKLYKIILFSGIVASAGVAQASNDEYGIIYAQLGVYTPYDEPAHESSHEEITSDPYGTIDALLGLDRGHSSYPVSPEY